MTKNDKQMCAMNDLTIIVPIYNEEATLPGVLSELEQFQAKTNCHIIAVNDGSTDKSKALLEQSKVANLELINHKLNRGYGGALKSGLKNVKTKYAITIDGDGQHYFEDIVRLYKRIKETDADMIVGSRKGQKNASKSRAVGKTIIRSLAKVMMTVPIYDINSGMKIYDTKLMQQYLHLCPDTMAFSDIITLVFINNRHLVLEEPISIKERAGGQSTIGLETAYHTIMEIINIIILFHPMKVFLPLSLLTFGFGATWTVYFLVVRQIITTGGSFFMISGILMFLLGLITEQLSHIRKDSSVI